MILDNTDNTDTVSWNTRKYTALLDNIQNVDVE